MPDVFSIIHLKNEIKILKEIRKNQTKKAKEICTSLDIDYDESMPVIRHLTNQGFIILVHLPGYVGPLLDWRDQYDITTNGIKHLENRIPKFVKSYIPIIFSSMAIGISILSYYK